MRQSIRLLLVTSVLVLSMLFSACANVFQPLSDKETDEAHFEDALKAMDEADWDVALENFDSMSSSFKGKTDVIEAWAGAFAGKCGLDFIDYFTSLSSATLSSTTIFTYLMNAWTQKVVSPQHCTLAQAKMEEISANPTARTEAENVFLAILGMVKIGTYLRTYADTDGSGGLGDGTPDAAVNVCTNNSTNLPDSAIDEIITGMGLVNTNLVYLTSALGPGDVTSAFDTLTTACSLSPGSCSKTSASAIVAADRDLYRDLLKTSSSNSSAPVGIGSCNNAVVTLCCP